MISINFPVLQRSLFFGTVTVKGPESMALNELGESFLFLITKPVLLKCTIPPRGGACLVSGCGLWYGVFFYTMHYFSCCEKKTSATVSPVLSAIILFLVGREAFQSNSVVLSQFELPLLRTSCHERLGEA